MAARRSRRDFLRQTAWATAGWTAGSYAWSRYARGQEAPPAPLAPDMVRFTPDLERLVRLLEETPKERAIAAVANELRAGLGPRSLMAALFLAGIRNVNPQPPGFKFHCVFVIDACQRLSLDLPEADRLMPFFYALGEFKDAQAEDVRLGDWVLRAPPADLPDPAAAPAELEAAMSAFDGPRADRAVTALARTAGSNELFETLFRWGAQDYRNIGHKAIYAAHAQRLLVTIGWQHAEPVLRSLVWALVDFGRDRRLNGYDFAGQSYLPNVELAEARLGDLPPDWAGPRRDPVATQELYAELREGRRAEACQLAIEQLASGRVQAAGVWDAIHLAGNELQTRRPGIFGIHAVTSKSSLHYAFRTAASPLNRLILLLQGLGWEAQFRTLMGSPEGVSRGGPLRDRALVTLEPAEVAADPREAAEQVLAAITAEPASRDRASALALGFGQRHPDSGELWGGVRQLLATKGDDPHEFKFALALAEDEAYLDPAWRPPHLATLVYYLPGSQEPPSPWLAEAREALRGSAAG